MNTIDRIASAGLARLARRYGRNFRAWRRRVRTERAIVDLPAHILKDIGWPHRFDQID